MPIIITNILQIVSRVGEGHGPRGWRGDGPAEPAQRFDEAGILSWQRGPRLFAVLGFERLHPFLDDERYDRECRDGICPPPAEGDVQ